MSELGVDTLCRIYVKIRDAKAAVTKEYDSKIAELEEQLEAVGNEIKDSIQALGDGATSVKTKYGLAMLKTERRYYARDWSAFRQFMREHDAMELTEKRVAQGEMEKWLEEHPDLVPPSLDSMSKIVVVVQRPRATA